MAAAWLMCFLLILVSPASFAVAATAGSTPPKPACCSQLEACPPDSGCADGFLQPEKDRKECKLLRQPPPSEYLKPDHSKIPVLGVPIDRDHDFFLLRWFWSIDHSAVQHIIIVTGGEETCLLDAVNHIAQNTKQLTHIHCDDSHSVAEGWNLVLTTYFDTAPWFVISAVDVQFKPGALRTLAKHMWSSNVNNVPDFAHISYSARDTPEWNVFIMTRRLLMRTGLFDENIVPAYFEDNDMKFRLDRLQPPIQRTTFSDVTANHGHLMQSGGHSGPTFNPTNPVRAAVIERARHLNGRYVAAKWGCNTREGYGFSLVVVATCLYATPFNVSGATLGTWLGTHVGLNRTHINAVLYGNETEPYEARPRS